MHQMGVELGPRGTNLQASKQMHENNPQLRMRTRIALSRVRVSPALICSPFASPPHAPFPILPIARAGRDSKRRRPPMRR